MSEQRLRFSHVKAGNRFILKGPALKTVTNEFGRKNVQIYWNAACLSIYCTSLQFKLVSLLNGR